MYVAFRSAKVRIFAERGGYFTLPPGGSAAIAAGEGELQPRSPQKAPLDPPRSFLATLPEGA